MTNDVIFWTDMLGYKFCHKKIHLQLLTLSSNWGAVHYHNRALLME
jgi:hypothetical protein